MISRLSQDEKANWPKHLPKLIQAYNGMRSAIMGYSLHYLLFGYHLRFLIDLIFLQYKKDALYASLTWLLCSNSISLKHSMKHAYKMYLKVIDKNYDHRSSTVVLKPGDIVLLKTDSYTGRRKTKNKWSYENYMVLHQLGLDILTYKIQVEGGLTCIVHQN